MKPWDMITKRHITYLLSVLTVLQTSPARRSNTHTCNVADVVAVIGTPTHFTAKSKMLCGGEMPEQNKMQYISAAVAAYVVASCQHATTYSTGNFTRCRNAMCDSSK